MIFEINANDVGKLDDNQFISLLRRLVQAELYKNKIPLRSGTIPAQLNIADGGEDGLVSWNGGINETDWLPSRFIIFQSKKGAISPSSLKKETHTKSSQGSDHPKLNEALEKALLNSGAYIIVTASAVVGTKVDNRIKAIKEGITMTGNDPSLLSSIQIYDCNRLAEWANIHPSVALWVNSLVQEIHLAGFQTFDDWSKDVEISQIEFQQSDDKRFVVSGIEVNRLKETDETIINPKSFKEIDEIISTFFLQYGKSVRIIGASGLGKSRFMHHLVKNKSKEFQDIFDNSQIIYCEYENVKNDLINIARNLADKDSKLILIVDDCPDDIHHKLSEIMNRRNSKSMVITIGVETVSYGLNNNLVVELQKASDDLIDHISKAINKNINNQNSSLIKELSQGFPKMAIYATQALDNKDEALSSVDMLIDKIIWGDNDQDESSLDSLQLLSLFTIVGLENKVSNELKEIAQFCGKSESLIYKELTSNFLQRGVLFRQGDYAMVQPLPLAIRLSNQWLEDNPADTLKRLFNSLSDDMKLRLVGRLRWLSWSDKVSNFARNTLSEALPSYDVMNSEFGAKLLERFVHLCPDITMNHLSSLFESKSIDDFLELKEGRYYIVSTLNKLSFRQQTFIPAAMLLLKLGAAETESYSNNSSGYFKNLFQLYLSGTEAEPEEKLFVLDKGLSNSDNRVRKLCIDALDRMLQSHSFTRVGGDEYIGSGKALEDWQPRTQNEIWSYYREALSRLKKIALNVNDSNKEVALEYIGSHLPSLFSTEDMFDDIKITISDLRKAYPNWYKPAFQLNTWLYFWRNDVCDEHQEILRAYYDELLPIEILDQIYFYSEQYSRDIHDPDTCYDRDVGRDYDYGNNKIQELIHASPKNAEYFLPLLDKFLVTPVNMARFTVYNIASYTGQPKPLLIYILEKLSCNDEIVIPIDLITNIIAAASKIDKDIGLECMELALQEQILLPYSIELIKSTGISNDLMPRIIDLIDKDIVEPYKVSDLIFYDQVDKIELQWIDKIVLSLLTKKSNGGWAVIDLLSRILYKTSVPKDLSKHIVKAITNQSLFSDIQYNPMGWYNWHELTKKVIEGEIDEACHNQIIDFIFSIVNVQEYGIQSSFADYARKILCLLIDISPKLVWEKYIHVLAATTDASIRFRLNNLLIVNFSNPKAPGILSKIPQEIYIPWMQEDKNQRISLILKWIELFDNANHNSRDIDDFIDKINNARYPWSLKFIDFIDKYIDDTNQLRILGERLQNGMWSGSYAQKLNIERDQLIKLKELSKNRYVHQWANDITSRLEGVILDEEKKHQNRHASFLA